MSLEKQLWTVSVCQWSTWIDERKCSSDDVTFKCICIQNVLYKLFLLTFSHAGQPLWHPVLLWCLSLTNWIYIRRTCLVQPRTFFINAGDTHCCFIHEVKENDTRVHESANTEMVKQRSLNVFARCTGAFSKTNHPKNLPVCWRQLPKWKCWPLNVRMRTHFSP